MVVGVGAAAEGAQEDEGFGCVGEDVGEEEEEGDDDDVECVLHLRTWRMAASSERVSVVTLTRAHHI